MNVYLIREDGEDRAWVAPSMQSAVLQAEQEHLRQAMQEATEETPYELEKERDYYRAEILQSCALVGELANLDYVANASPEVWGAVTTA